MFNRLKPGTLCAAWKWKPVVCHNAGFSLYASRPSWRSFSKNLSGMNVRCFSQSSHSFTAPIELSQIMTPNDTNVAGNVHGGTILNLIERAGFIVSTRHCNQGIGKDQKGPLTAALVRLERMDFYKPVFVGDVAQFQAAVTYTSPHSIEVTVDVWANNIITGERRLTNSAHLWYVAVPARVLEKGANEDLHTQVQPVPQLEGLSQTQLEMGRKRYNQQISSRLKETVNADTLSQQDFISTSREFEPNTVLASQSTLANLVMPFDCNMYNHLTGGSLMKMMDNAATICTEKHCGGRVVTACIDEINFNIPISSGQMVFVTARLVYVSNKSMEVEVTTEAEGPCNTRHVTNTAYFTFVSLGPDLSAQPVPPLELKSEEEITRFQEGKKRYYNRKKIRTENATDRSRNS